MRAAEPVRRPSRSGGVLAFAAVAVLAAPAPALALGRAGDPDPTFNGGTAATADLAATSPRTTFFRDVLVDAAGRLLVSGSTSDADGRTALVLARFGANGVRDGSFGTQGAFVRQLGSGSNVYSTSSGLFDVPGRYAGAAAYRTVGPRVTQSAFLVRDDGTPDLDVGSGGLLTQDPVAPPGYANTSAGAAGPDGSVYVTGVVEANPTTGANRKLALTKFTPQGLAAPGWGTNNGTWIGSFSQSGSDTGTYGGALLPVGTNRILVAGVALLPSGRFGALVSRFLTASGTPDTTFGTAPGRTVVNASDPGAGAGADSQITALAAGPDGEIYAAGTADDAAGEQSVLVMRLTTAGAPDGTFGVGGVKRLQLGGTGERSSAQDLVVQPDGKVVVSAGVYGGGGGDSSSRLVRLLDDGTLDPSFGQNGVVTPTAGATPLSAGGLAISGNRLLVAGSVRDGTKYHGAVGAYLLAPLPDPPPVGDPGPGPGPAGPGPAPGGTPTPSPGGGPAPARAGVAAFKGTRLKVDRRGRLKVPVSCSAAGPCSGRVVLFAATGTPALQPSARKRKGTAPIYVEGRYAVKASRTATVTLKLKKAVRAKARGRRGLKARLAVVPTSGKARTWKVRLVR